MGLGARGSGSEVVATYSGNQIKMDHDLMFARAVENIKRLSGKPSGFGGTN
jgi:hypothetical protein